MVTIVYKTGLEIWGPPPLEKLAAQRCHNFAQFRRTLQLVRTYLSIGTRWTQVRGPEIDRRQSLI